MAGQIWQCEVDQRQETNHSPTKQIWQCELDQRQETNDDNAKSTKDIPTPGKKVSLKLGPAM